MDQKPKSASVAKGFGITSLVFIAGALLSIGAAFSIGGWGALIPLLMGLASALLAIVTGIVALIALAVFKASGYQSPKKVRDETPGQARRRQLRVIAISAGIPVALAAFGFFTFTAPLEEVSKTVNVLNSIESDAPESFHLNWDEKNPIRFCITRAYCATESSANYSYNGSSRTGFCITTAKWLSKHGLTDAVISGGYGVKTKVGSPMYVMACNNLTLSIELHGITDANWYANLDQPGFNGVDITAFRTGEVEFDDPITYEQNLANLDEFSAYYFSVLNAIGTWRVNHPDQDPDSLGSLKAAVAASDNKLVRSTKFVGKGKDIQFGFIKTSADPSQYLCVSVTKYDEQHFGVADPGYGYFPSNPNGESFVFGDMVDPTFCGQKND